jgi:hypothetical protein
MLDAALCLMPDTAIEVWPVQGYPDTAVIRLGSYNGGRLTVHVQLEDIERLTAALSQARDMLQANAAAVAA